MKSKTTPYPFQIEGANKLKAFGGRALLADSMGLGKSVQSLMVVNDLPSARPVIVVCPKSAKWHWENEARKHFGMRSEVLETGKPPTNYLVGRLTEILIINYDILGKWLPFLKKLNPKIIIVDECHYAKNFRAKRTKNLKKLCEGVPHVLALSGTPITNRPAELWPILNIIRPDLFPSFFPYAQRWCAAYLGRFGWDFSGASHLPELHNILLRNCMVRRTKEQVLSSLPPKSREVLLLPLEDEKQYKKALGDFLGWMKSQGKSVLKASKAMALTQTTLIKHLIARLKLPAVLDWVDDYLAESDDKLILFGIHHDIVGAIYEEFKRESVLVTGKVTGRDRQACFDQFNKDKKTRLFIGNLQAAGLGWSASACSTVAFCEMGWIPAEHQQAEDRVSGLNRGIAGRNAVAVYLAAKGTIEEKLASILQHKAAILDAVLDGKGKKDAPTLDVFDLFMNEVFEQEGITTK